MDVAHTNLTKPPVSRFAHVHGFLRRMREREQGFALTEVLIASGMILVAATTFTMMNAGTAKVQSKNRIDAQMVGVAESVWDVARSETGWVKDCQTKFRADVAECDITTEVLSNAGDAVDASDDGSRSGVNYDFEVLARGIDAEADGVGAADSDGFSPDYFRVSVQVFAKEPGGARLAQFRQVMRGGIISPWSGQTSGSLTAQLCGVYPQIDERMQLTGCLETSSSYVLDAEIPASFDRTERPDFVALQNVPAANVERQIQIRPIQDASVRVLDAATNALVKGPFESEDDGSIYVNTLKPGRYNLRVTFDADTKIPLSSGSMAVTRTLWKLWGTHTIPSKTAESVTDYDIGFTIEAGENTSALGAFRYQPDANGSGRLRMRLGSDTSVNSTPQSTRRLTHWDSLLNNSAPWLLAGRSPAGLPPGYAFDDTGGYWVRPLPAPFGREHIKGIDQYASDTERRAAGWAYVCPATRLFTHRNSAYTCADNRVEEHRVRYRHRHNHPQWQVADVPVYQWRDRPIFNYHEWHVFNTWTQSHHDNNPGSAGNPVNATNHKTHWWVTVDYAEVTGNWCWSRSNDDACRSPNDANMGPHMDKHALAADGILNAGPFNSPYSQDADPSHSDYAASLNCANGVNEANGRRHCVENFISAPYGSSRAGHMERNTAVHLHTSPGGVPDFPACTSDKGDLYPQTSQLGAAQNYAPLTHGRCLFSGGYDWGSTGNTSCGGRGPADCRVVAWNPRDIGTQHPAHPESVTGYEEGPAPNSSLHDTRFGDPRSAWAPKTDSGPRPPCNAGTYLAPYQGSLAPGVTNNRTPTCGVYTTRLHDEMLCCDIQKRTYANHREWVEFQNLPAGLYSAGLMRDRVGDSQGPVVVPLVGSNARYMWIDPISAAANRPQFSATSDTTAVAVSSCPVSDCRGIGRPALDRYSGVGS